MQRPVVLVEGIGDQSAVPELLRRCAYFNEIYDFVPVPRPLKIGPIPRLLRPGEIERVIRYATMRPEADSVLISVDCDDHCPKEIVRALIDRATAAMPHMNRPLGLVLFKREFETLFLSSLESLSQSYQDMNWNFQNFNSDAEMEEIRGAKETLSRLMGGSYKETRDQTRFVSALDFEKLRERSRSYRHFEATVLWLKDATPNTAKWYPFRP